jgi:hypothetical protein
LWPSDLPFCLSADGLQRRKQQRQQLQAYAPVVENQGRKRCLLLRTGTHSPARTPRLLESCAGAEACQENRKDDWAANWK